MQEGNEREMRKAKWGRIEKTKSRNANFLFAVRRSLLPRFRAPYFLPLAGLHGNV
jgi:hypothetical protein